MKREKIMRVKFIGRKKTNRVETFNYFIQQNVFANDLGDAIEKLEQKYIVTETLEYYGI